MAGPPPDGLARSREMVERIAGAALPGGFSDAGAASPVVFPAAFSDEDVLLVGTGRRDPTEAERRALGELAPALPFHLG